MSLFRNYFFLKSIVLAMLILILDGCARPLSNIENACDIFAERPLWKMAADESEQRWGIPIPVMLAIIYHESHFEADARPPRKRIFGVIPNGYTSSALGYAQAIDQTWKEYIIGSGNRVADRTAFKDAIDFVGWYSRFSHRNLKIPKNDAENMYLAYHEGRSGYARGSHKKKPWLLEVAKSVKKLENTYREQLETCK